MIAQIIWGSLLLGVCAIIHVGLLVVAIPATKSVNHSSHNFHRLARKSILILLVLAFIVCSHTIQVWLWAFCFIMLDVLPNVEEAIYFSLVTYTTVGYGDVTIGPGYRIFAAMASVTGLLTFGLSTAFLVSLFDRLRTSD